MAAPEQRKHKSRHRQAEESERAQALQPQPAIEVSAALLELTAIAIGAQRQSIGNGEQARLVAVAAAFEAARTFVVGEIETSSVTGSKVKLLSQTVQVPPDEVDRVCKTVTSSVASALSQVLLPGSVDHLGVAERGGRPPPRNEAQQLPSGWAGTGMKAGLLMNHRHDQRFSDLPVLCGEACVAIPGEPLVKQLAEILRGFWRRYRAPHRPPQHDDDRGRCQCEKRAAGVALEVTPKCHEWAGPTPFASAERANFLRTGHWPSLVVGVVVDRHLVVVGGGQAFT